MRIKTSVSTLALGLLAITGCSEGPAKRATEDVGPVSVQARNSLASSNPEGLVKVGQGFERAGDYAGALALYNQALAAAPNLLSAKIALARILVPLGKPSEAAAQLADLMAAHPDSREVRAEYINALVAAGQYQEASAAVQPMLSGITSSAILDLAGRLAFVAGNKESARQHFDDGLKNNPTDGNILNHLALTYAIEGEFETAVAILGRAMDRPDTQLAAQRSLATIYALSGQKDAALGIARSSMSSEEANNLRTFYELLPKLSEQEQAEALMFDRIPTTVIEKLRTP